LKNINKKYYTTITVSSGSVKELTEEEFKNGKPGIVWLDNKTGKIRFKDSK